MAALEGRDPQRLCACVVRRQRRPKKWARPNRGIQRGWLRAVLERAWSVSVSVCHIGGDVDGENMDIGRDESDDAQEQDGDLAMSDMNRGPKEHQV